MTVVSAKLSPGLQYWVNQVFVNSTLNKYQIPIPPTMDATYVPNNSVVELMFNESYPYASYRYLYREVTDRYGWPRPVKERLMIYSTSAQYYKCDGDPVDCTINLFSLQADDLTMLDALLLYRTDSTAVTLVDSTSTVIIGTRVEVNYEGLSTGLSKLIYLYLALKINRVITRYDNTTLLSTSTNILAMCFEAFLIDEIFKFVSNQGT